MERRVKSLQRTHEVSFDAIFTNSFMRKHSKFSTFDEFLKFSGFNVETSEDFEAIPDNDLDKYVAENTKFKTRKDMLGEATSQYTLQKIGF